MYIYFYLVELVELLQLVLGLVLELGAVLAEALELVYELVDHVPEPLVGQLHVDDAVEDFEAEEEEDVVSVAVGRVAEEAVGEASTAPSSRS
jgi:uncharacterized protein (DUF2249 family)